MLNVCGEQELQRRSAAKPLPHLHRERSGQGAVPHRQRRRRKRFARRFRTITRIFTFGENIGSETFPGAVARHPVAAHAPADRHRFLESEVSAAEGAVFTSVANWNTKGKDIEWRGDKYLWSKALEFLRFMDAPRRAGETFELRDQPPRRSHACSTRRARLAVDESAGNQHRSQCVCALHAGLQG